MTILRDSQLKLIGSELYFTGDDPTRAFRFRPESTSLLHLEAEDTLGNYTQMLTFDGDNQYIGVFNASPSYPLDINGDTQVIGNLNVLGLFSGSGGGITAGTISLSALQSIATDTLLGRSALGTGPVSTVVCTAAGRALIDDANNTAQRTTLGLGTIATQNSNGISITGGTITGITDLAVADGGTGASTASAARTNLGLGTIAVQNDNAVSLTGAMTTTNLIASTNDDSRFLMMGGSGAPTKAFSINYSAALDAQGNMTFQRRTTLNAFEAVVGGYMIAANRWFFGATSFSSVLFNVDGDAAIRGDLTMFSAGNGFRIAEGTNGTSGVATLVAGTVTVNTTKALTNSRIHITSNVSGGTPGWLRVSARVNATSFTITSSSATDTSQVAWLIINQ